MSNMWTSEEEGEHVSKIASLLKSKDEDQEQASVFISSFTDNESFMDKMRAIVLEIFGEGTMWFKGDNGILLKTAALSLNMGKQSTLFLRLLKNGLITAEHLDSLTLSDVTGRMLGEACSKLTNLTSLTLKCSPGWSGNSVEMSTLPKELALCTSLLVLNIGRYQNLVADTFDAPLSIRRLNSMGSTDGLLHGLLPWMPDIEVINLAIQWRCSSISSIPDTIATCTKLKQLNCSQHWSLKQVSEKIGECTQLKSLNLGSTGLQVLPHTLAKLSKLKSLKIHNTSIRYISPLIFALPSLNRINASGCTNLIIQTNEVFQLKIRWKRRETAYPNDSRHRNTFVKQSFFEQK
jgi:hypothetical protein